MVTTTISIHSKTQIIKIEGLWGKIKDMIQKNIDPTLFVYKWESQPDTIQKNRSDPVCILMEITDRIQHEISIGPYLYTDGNPNRLCPTST